MLSAIKLSASSNDYQCLVLLSEHIYLTTTHNKRKYKPMQLKSLATFSGIATLVAVGALANVKPASAAPASGILNFGGDVAFTTTSFDFSGTPVVSKTSTGTFASLIGDPVTVTSFAAPTTDVPGFVSVGGYSFNLTGFNPNTDVVIGASPNGQTTATVATNGNWTGGGGISDGLGTFTAQVTSPTTYSASITANPVPEPSETLGVLALGAVGGGMAFLRKRQSVNV
ncbi:MAG: PEP-CTERM sorting domain-containing protein [Chroococcidiopsidaceae cyanobacterium CP_BM_RX_35]|nr:PEP-CTERM sorting domain-containing protein [Chroococcidiopsidaceae cyanobacterium CP_BM_RX_35]